MYVHLKFGEELDHKHRRYGKKSISPILVVVVLFFSLNPCILKTVRGTGLKFCTQVVSNDPMCSDL